jgi:hypothetical protein
MATVIIKPGRKTFHGVCSDCGCEFRYERSDVMHNYVKGGDWVHCPDCGEPMRHFGESGTSWPPSPPRCYPRRGSYATWRVAAS